MKTHARPEGRFLCNAKATSLVWSDAPAKVSCRHCRKALRRGTQVELRLGPDWASLAREEAEWRALEMGEVLG